MEFGGEVRVKLQCSNRSYVPFVFQARYSLQAPYNLISNSQLAVDRVFVEGIKNQLILSNGREVAQRKWIDGVAVLTLQHQPDSIPFEVQNVAFATVAFRTHIPGNTRRSPLAEPSLPSPAIAANKETKSQRRRLLRTRREVNYRELAGVLLRKKRQLLALSHLKHLYQVP